MPRSIEQIVRDGIRKEMLKEFERQEEEEVLRQKRKYLQFQREEDERRLREPGEG